MYVGCLEQPKYYLQVHWKLNAENSGATGKILTGLEALVFMGGGGIQ